MHSCQSYESGKFEPSDEVRIQCQDLITTNNSFKDPPKDCHLDNTDTFMLFNEIRCELNEQIIESNRNPGISAIIKYLVSLSHWENRGLQYARC